MSAPDTYAVGNQHPNRKSDGAARQPKRELAGADLARWEHVGFGQWWLFKHWYINVLFVFRYSVHGMNLPDGTVVTADGGVVLMSESTGVFILLVMLIFCFAVLLAAKISFDVKLFL